MTLHAYQTLYESSIAFGIRKALQAEQVRKKFQKTTFESGSKIRGKLLGNQTTIVIPHSIIVELRGSILGR